MAISIISRHCKTSIKNKMPIPTSRTRENAEIQIDAETCDGCGLCVSVCKGTNLKIFENKAVKTASSGFGCYGCGQCMAVCPTGAIRIFGRELSPNDLFDLPGKESKAGYHQLLSLLQHRRSIREFTTCAVDAAIIEKILTVARTAPMGLPPSDVNVLVINGKEKTRAFAHDFSQFLKGMKFMTSKVFLALMRPFWGKENDELFREFINPLFKAYTEDMAAGQNLITYDAPLLMYFYGTPYSDRADAVIAATYAMIAAESLGLGSCMLGAIHPFIQNGKKGRRFREKHQIHHKSRSGLFIALGYPAITYKKGIERSFASISHYA